MEIMQDPSRLNLWKLYRIFYRFLSHREGSWQGSRWNFTMHALSLPGWIWGNYAGFSVVCFHTERDPGRAPGEIARCMLSPFQAESVEIMQDFLSSAFTPSGILVGCVLSPFQAESVEIMQDFLSFPFTPRGILAGLLVKLHDVCSLPSRLNLWKLCRIFCRLLSHREGSWQGSWWNCIGAEVFDCSSLKFFLKCSIY